MQKKLTAKIDCRGMEDSEIIETILNDREIDDLSGFLYPSEDDMIPFKDLKNIDKAYTIIDDGIMMGERKINNTKCIGETK